MSMFGDYKSYRKYAPEYKEWKSARDLAEAKRVEYLRENPNKIQKKDIQKSKAILRAIDIMDEYSQKKAENTEVATESVTSYGLQLAATAGVFLGLLTTRLKPIQKLIQKHTHNKNQAKIFTIISTVMGGILGTVAAFPLYAWAAKAEVKASRKGRFEAMNNELKNPKVFALLTDEQEQELQKNTNLYKKTKDSKKPLKGIKESFNTIKDILYDSKSYKKQKSDFENELAKDKTLFDKELTPKEIEDAKKDQQLLTKLVEKIDIASQDYAENAELATSTLITLAFGLSSLFALGYEKIAKKLKLKSTSAPGIVGLIAILGTSVFGASIQKQAARVGRFKIKQELLKNPEQLVYVADEKTGEIKDVKINTQKKEGMLKFLKNAWKNNKEFEKWKKEEGHIEKNYAKAIENINISAEQLADAKRLQYNTFKTFNKVDENSQKYAESIEALGQSIQYPISMICSTIGIAFGLKHLNKIPATKNAKNLIDPLIKYVATIFLATLPAIGINAYITKEQKKASRVAGMMAINELQDYRNFADYSKFKNS